MPNTGEFTELLKRAKAGDEDAIRDFLSRFEHEVQAMVRSRLPKRLRTQFDSADFMQLVWKSFFLDRREESPNFDDVENFRCFLFGMVRNKVREQSRRLTKTEKYDLNREEPLYVKRGDREMVRDVISTEPSPSQTIEAVEQMDQMTAGRSEREIEVLKLRRQGLTLVEIAAKTGFNERKVRRVIAEVRLWWEAHRCRT